LNLYVLFHREENAAAIAGAGDVYGTVNSGPPGWKAASEPQTPTEVQAQVGVATRVSRFCRRCGTPVSDGKRFCSQCGLEIAQRQEAPKPADVVPNETSAPEPAVVTEATVPPAAAAAFAAKAPEVPFFAPAAEPVHTVTQYVEPVFVESSIEPEEKGIVVVPSRKTGPAVWLIMAIASVLVIAAAAVWIYEWHRGATIASLFGSSNTSEPATSPQVQPQPQAQVLPQPQTPNPESEVQQKSPAGVAEDHPSAQVTSSSTGKRQVTNPTQGKNTVAGGNVASTTSNPQDQTPPPHAVVANPPVVNPPQLPTNGMLHYSGPPVPFGGTVTFTGLPGGRLRFTFDHSAWQPLISRQPDGTQTLTLRSLKQVVQTQCEVAWAIVQ
jgi:hypothetical protein